MLLSSKRQFSSAEHLEQRGPHADEGRHGCATVSVPIGGVALSASDMAAALPFVPHPAPPATTGPSSGAGGRAAPPRSPAANAPGARRPPSGASRTCSSRQWSGKHRSAAGAGTLFWHSADWAKGGVFNFCLLHFPNCCVPENTPPRQIRARQPPLSA